MAFDSEEFLRRKELRQQRQQEKAKKAKKQRLILIISAIAAAAVMIGFLIFALMQIPGKPNSGGSAQSTEGTSATEQTQPNTTVIHLAAAGDLNVTESVVASGGSNYDYTETFLDVAAILAQADIATVNFEGAIYGTDYGTDRCAPQTLAQALQKAGVDLVQLANSYSIYKGMEGLASTVNGIKLAGMEPVGVYANAQDAKAGKGYTIKTVNGVKVAFVAFTKGMDGMALPAGSESCVNVLYSDYASTYQQVDTQRIVDTLAAAKREKPDVVVALLHWGSEFNDTISTTQEEICQLLQDNGVDAIIGTHSHYVQKMEFDPEKGTFVAYSLGDFLGDASRSGSEYSVILDLEITKNNDTGDAKITGYSYTPIFTVNQDGSAKVLRIAQAMQAYKDGYISAVSAETYGAMEYALTRIEERIKGE